MYKILKDVNEIETSNGRIWNDLCIRLPVPFVKLDDIEQRKRRRKRQVEDLDFFDDFEPFDTEFDFKFDFM